MNQNVARGAATREHLFAVATALFVARPDSPDEATLAGTGAIDESCPACSPALADQARSRGLGLVTSTRAREPASTIPPRLQRTI